MDDLMSEFAGELRESYAALAPQLPRWRGDPLDAATGDAIFRFLHSAKGGAGFLRLARVEQLAAAAETALMDLRHWDLPRESPQIDLIIQALERIFGIAEAVELGVGLPALGEEALVSQLSGGETIFASESVPYEPQQISSVRLPLNTLDTLIKETELLNTYLVELGDAPLPSALAIMRNDMKGHVQSVRALRYIPATQLFVGLDGYVAELAAVAGKSVGFCTEDGGVTVDRAIVPILRNALSHLIRNAIAHGIESAALRRERGKPDVGMITLSAHTAEQFLWLDVADDGGGVDYRALVAQAEIEAYAHQDPLALILRPGVTTAPNVTILSGCGVGLDSVRIAMERIDGHLELFDRPGEGFTARLVIPSRKAR